MDAQPKSRRLDGRNRWRQVRHSVQGITRPLLVLVIGRSAGSKNVVPANQKFGSHERRETK